MTRHTLFRDGSTPETVFIDGYIDITVTLNPPLKAMVEAHAKRRGIRVDVLAALVLEHVFRDDLVNSILDDGK